MLDTTIKSNLNKIHPHKFALWLSFASIIMMFSGLTSAYIVRQAQGNFLEFKIPDIFFYNTGVIFISSLVLHGSYIAFKKGKGALYRGLMILAFMLGVLFVVLQYYGWVTLSDSGVKIVGNPGGSFFYVIPGIHAAHVLGGLAALAIALAHAFFLKYVPTERRRARFELTLQYWHFVDALWIYLMVFFVVIQS